MENFQIMIKIINMPVSKSYCLKTPIKKMGFSQKASCKAQGFIDRTSKKNYGKKIKSSKYKAKFSMNTSLFDNGSKKPRTKTGYANKEKAIMTIKNIKKYDKQYQMRVINTLYNRAKYHKYQTKEMREAMKIFKKYLTKL